MPSGSSTKSCTDWTSGLGGVVGDVGRDGDLALHGLHDVVDHDAAHQEHADDEQRQEDGDDGAERRGEVAREAAQRLLEEIEED